MLELKVNRKLDINEATDWCHNLVLVRKPNGKLRVCLDPHTINKALRFNVHNARTFQDIVSNLGTCFNIIADDIMIHRDCDEQHDRHLLQVLNKCREIGVKLNPDKCKFGQPSVTFYGNVVSNLGLRPDSQES